MRALMRSLTPTSFDDVAALVALYRPGPMAANMHNDYADRKNGRKPIEYLHPDLEEVLGDTYGLMIYQESVMRVAQKIAGYSLAEADNLRKAMGKKIRELIANERHEFVDGVERTGYGRAARHPAVRHHRAVRRLRVQQEPRLRLRARRLPDRLPQGALPGRVLRLPAHQRQGHAREGGGLHRRVPGDGHPGAHPRHQPLGDRLRRARRRRSARRRRPARSAAPARSRSGCRPCATSARASSSCCSSERDANGPFASFHDFAERVPEPVLNKRAVESLIKAGAFDSARPHPQGPARRVRAHHRHHARASPRARARRDEPVRRLSGEVGGTTSGAFDERRADPRAWSSTRPSLLRNEKEMLGLYVSDHPLFGVEAALRRKVEQSISDLDELGDGATVRRRRRGHRPGPQVHQEGRPDGRRSCLEDLEASIEVMLFPRTLAEHGHKLADDAIVAVRGRIDRRDEARVSLIVPGHRGARRASRTARRRRSRCACPATPRSTSCDPAPQADPARPPRRLGRACSTSAASRCCASPTSSASTSTASCRELRMAFGHDAIVL